MTSITIKIFKGENLIGVAQNLSIREALPDNNNPKLQILRLRLDRTKLTEIFTSEMVHVASQKYPFQIVVEQRDEEKITPLLTIHNAWLTSTGYVYTTTDWIIVEDSLLDAEYISGNFISS